MSEDLISKQAQSDAVSVPMHFYSTTENVYTSQAYYLHCVGYELAFQNLYCL